MASDEGIPTEGMVQNRSWPTHPIMMLMVRLTVILVAVIPHTTERLITSSFVQDLMCSQNDEVIHPDLCGASYRSTF